MNKEYFKHLFKYCNAPGEPLKCIGYCLPEEAPEYIQKKAAKPYTHYRELKYWDYDGTSYYKKGGHLGYWETQLAIKLINLKEDEESIGETKED